MKVVGLYLLRNEVDLVEVNLSHHFATAIDEAIVIDNGSTDGTLEKLIELADSMPIQIGERARSLRSVQPSHENGEAGRAERR